MNVQSLTMCKSLYLLSLIFGQVTEATSAREKPRHPILQLLLENAKVFPCQRGCITPPVCSGSASRPLPNGTHLENLQRAWTTSAELFWCKRAAAQLPLDDERRRMSNLLTLYLRLILATCIWDLILWIMIHDYRWWWEHIDKKAAFPFNSILLSPKLTEAAPSLPRSRPGSFHPTLVYQHSWTRQTDSWTPPLRQFKFLGVGVSVVILLPFHLSISSTRVLVLLLTKLMLVSCLEILNCPQK